MILRMIVAIKRLILLIALLVILAFVFSDGLLYYVSKWHEKSGDVKKAIGGYTGLVKKYPNSRWTQRAKKAVDRLKNLKGK